MRTTHLTFVSAAAMTISAACVYWITPAGGVASVARADVELAPAAMLEPDSDWFRGEAEGALPGATAVATAIVTSEPQAFAPPIQAAAAVPPSTRTSWKPTRRAPKAEPGFLPQPATARPIAVQAPRKPTTSFASPPQQPASFPQQASFPQPQVAFPQQAAFPASTAFAAPSSTSFGSKK